MVRVIVGIMKLNVVDTVVVIRPGTKLALEVPFGGPLGEFLANETGAILKRGQPQRRKRKHQKEIEGRLNVVRPDDQLTMIPT